MHKTAEGLSNITTFDTQTLLRRQTTMNPFVNSFATGEERELADHKAIRWITLTSCDFLLQPKVCRSMVRLEPHTLHQHKPTRES